MATGSRRTTTTIPLPEAHPLLLAGRRHLSGRRASAKPRRAFLGARRPGADADDLRLWQALGGPRTGLLAGPIVATSFGYFPIARSSLPDLPLAFFISLATWTLCEAMLGRPVWPANHGTELSPQEFPEGDRESEGRGWCKSAAAGTNTATPCLRIATPPERHVTSPARRHAGAGYARPASDREPSRERLAASAARRWWLMLGRGDRAGVLTKGPVALALPAMIVLRSSLDDAQVAAAVERRLARSVLASAAAGLVLLAVALPWFGAMVATHGTAYLGRFFVGENLERFATDRYNDRRPFWFYVPILLGGLTPWSPLCSSGIPTASEAASGGPPIEWRPCCGRGALRVLHALDRQAAALHPADSAAARAAHRPHDAARIDEAMRGGCRAAAPPRSRDRATFSAVG